MDSISYGRQHISDEDVAAVVETLKSDYLTQGPKIKEFEDAFAKEVGVKHAIAVSNGTAALHIAAMSLGIKEGDNVIVTPLTFVASANCVRYCRGKVHFCDINLDNFLLDLNKLRQMLENQPKGYYKGIIPVDFAGYPIHAEELKKICDEYDMWIIEDACHAPGAYFVDSKGNKQLVGNGIHSDLTVFSFHPVKHIATGEGGMITTNNDELNYKLRCLRTHGICQNSELLTENRGAWYYEMQELGYNYRITDIQCALGISQLKRLKWSVEKRQEIAEKYNQAFAKVSSIKTPNVSCDVYHAYHLYVIQAEDRDGLYTFLRENNIFAQIHYEPVHLMPYYQNLGNKRGDLPVVENYALHCLSLPNFPTLTDEEQDYVIEKLMEFVKR